MKLRCKMKDSKLYNEVRQSFLQKKMQEEEKCAQLIEDLCQDEKFNSLYKSYNSNQLKLMRADYEKSKKDLEQKVEELKTQLNQLLKKKNMDINSLSPKYDCEICHDTGVVDGRLCECMKKELNRRKTEKLNSNANFKSFKDANHKIMSEGEIKALNKLKDWCNNYPNVNILNILLYGATGVGKTFMLECVASELIEKGVEVCFKTAFEFNELARLYHIGKSFDFTSLIDAEVLIIDDLGTEPILNNVTFEYLYNLVNTRLSHSRPTLFSTNLSLDDLLELYEERIFSRITIRGLSMNIELTGNNKRG